MVAALLDHNPNWDADPIIPDWELGVDLTSWIWYLSLEMIVLKARNCVCVPGVALMYLLRARTD